MKKVFFSSKFSLLNLQKRNYSSISFQGRYEEVSFIPELLYWSNQTRERLNGHVGHKLVPLSQALHVIEGIILPQMKG